VKFTISDFRKKFPNDNACLDEVFRLRHSDMKICPECEKETKFHRVKNRRCYECQWCGRQVYPTKGTIFEKSTTPLTHWFYAMYLMTATRSGVSAKELERQLGVTYKCAWRMAHQIRKLMGNGTNEKLTGTVEIDDTYIGGKRKGKRGRGAEGKTIIFGMVERKGNLKAVKVDNIKRKTVAPIIAESIETGSKIHSDELLSYRFLSRADYDHDYVKHSTKEFVRNDCHTQAIDGFWSQLKRSISGTHVWISKKHSQKYVDEFAFRYSLRQTPTTMFIHLLNRLSQPSSVRH